MQASDREVYYVRPIARRHHYLADDAARLVLADWSKRKTYLAVLTDSLRAEALADPESDRRGPDRVVKLLTELGPAAKDAAPDLTKILGECKVAGTKAAIARVLRAVDLEAARKAGVR